MAQAITESVATLERLLASYGFAEEATELATLQPYLTDTHFRSAAAELASVEFWAKDGLLREVNFLRASRERGEQALHDTLLYQSELIRLGRALSAMGLGNVWIDDAVDILSDWKKHHEFERIYKRYYT